MKRTYKKMSLGVLVCFLAVSPVVKPGAVETVEPVTVNSINPVPVFKSVKVVAKTAAQKLAEEAIGLYNEMDLGSYGLSTSAFEYALKGYKYLVETGKVM